MNDNTFKLLSPLYEIVRGVDNLIDENNRLRKENEELKEELNWFRENLEKNAKASGEAMHKLLDACLDGKVIINNNETIIKH